MKYFVYCRKSSEAEERQALSLDSQAAEIARSFGDSPEVEIVEVIRESMSAKAPGRPIFNQVIERIRRGEADGIVAWHPDRLARNSVDGGLIIYLLDQGIIKDLRFANFSFENSSQGKFMLQIMFGYSKYYVDNLSENVKRGMRAKASKGWRSGRVPVGYKNCRETGTIVPDPKTFPIIERLFQTALQRTHNVSELWRLVTNEWGLRTPRHARSGGGPWTLSAFYHALGNEFYAGYFEHAGVRYRGKHVPAVSVSDFAQIQRWLGRSNSRRPSRHQFTYTGLFRCGACGLMVTAEHKTNRYGTHYTYYHCTKRNVGTKCRQQSIEARALDEQIVSFLETLRIDDTIDHALRECARSLNESSQENAVARESLEQALASVKTQEGTLLDLRVRGLISDDEFSLKRRDVQREREVLVESSERLSRQSNWFEPFDEAIAFSKMAVQWFKDGNDEVRRLILQTVGSNLQLTDKNVRIDAAFPFSTMQKTPYFVSECGFVEDVRTRLLSNDKDFLERIEQIRVIKEKVGAPVITPSEVSKRGPGRGGGADAPAPADHRRSFPEELSFSGGP